MSYQGETRPAFFNLKPTALLTGKTAMHKKIHEIKEITLQQKQ
jgi:hypothetical protein